MATEHTSNRLTGRHVLAVVIAILVLVVVLQNNDETSVTIHGYEATLALWLVLLDGALLGSAVGYLAGRRR